MVDKSNFVNHFEMDEDVQQILEDGWDGRLPERRILEVGQSDTGIDVINGLLTPQIAVLLRRQLDKHKWQAVGLDGRADHTYSEIGNYRLSNWNPGFAARLWDRLQGFFPDFAICDAFSPTDHEGHARWKPAGVSPLFRYIRYAEGGKLVGHYDETFRESDSRRTLMSLVIYLTSNQRGATRFLHDKQLGKPMSEYNFADWDRAGNDDEVMLRVTPHPGKALMFGHRILHDSEPLAEGDPEKIIIRTDIMFEKV